jgi:hypothetical protein
MNPMRRERELLVVPLALAILVPTWPATPVAAQSAPSTAPSPMSTGASAFDGNWAVTIACEAAADGARGYTFRFPARIDDGALHGEKGTKGEATWLTLDGRLKADGSSTLTVHGLTGSPDYNVGRVAQLTPYTYHVTAQFEAAHGTGTRVELRPCTLEFVKGKPESDKPAT